MVWGGSLVVLEAEVSGRVPGRRSLEHIRHVDFDRDLGRLLALNPKP